MSATNTISLDDCWLSAKKPRPDGYVLIRSKIQGKEVSLYAHRVIYENMVGIIPKGKVVDHLCRVRCCINPSHMRVVTIGENVMAGTGIAAANKIKTHCPKRHIYNNKNTYIAPNGGRSCKVCRKLWARNNYNLATWTK